MSWNQSQHRILPLHFLKHTINIFHETYHVHTSTILALGAIFAVILITKQLHHTGLNRLHFRCFVNICSSWPFFAATTCRGAVGCSATSFQLGCSLQKTGSR